MSIKKSEEDRISTVPPFGLRMLPDLKERVTNAAEKSGRSINSEIIARLEDSFHLKEPENSVLDQVADLFATSLEQSPDDFGESEVDAVWQKYQSLKAREIEAVTEFLDMISEIQKRAFAKKIGRGFENFESKPSPGKYK